MPSCSKCPAPAVVHLRYAGTHLCREDFLAFFAKRAKADLARQGKLPEGTIGVALSGGKDSVSVLHFLRELVKDHPRIHLVALTVDEGIAGYRDSSLDICRDLTRQWGIPWHVIKTQDLAGYSIDEYAAGARGPRLPMAASTGKPRGEDGHTVADAQRDAGTKSGALQDGMTEDAPGQPRPACGPCGVFRRAGLNRLARQLGCIAVVTGHNLDDQAQTILMNHLKGDLDRLARMAPHTAEDAAHAPGLIPRLLPFRSIPEKEVLLYAVLHGLPLHHDAECPYAARSHRFAMRDLLAGLEAQTPGTRHALVKGAERLKPILQGALPAIEVRSCPECGDPTSGDVCVACQLRA